MICPQSQSSVAPTDNKLDDLKKCAISNFRGKSCNPKWQLHLFQRCLLIIPTPGNRRDGWTSSGFLIGRWREPSSWRHYLIGLCLVQMLGKLLFFWSDLVPPGITEKRPFLRFAEKRKTGRKSVFFQKNFRNLLKDWYSLGKRVLFPFHNFSRSWLEHG